MVGWESDDFSLVYYELYYKFIEVYRIRNSVEKGGLNDTEPLIFTCNWVFKSVFYKEISKTPLLFETLLILHGVHNYGG